ncbi:MAG: glycosyltransferase family 2 protein [Pseudomonadota bacterium]
MPASFSVVFYAKEDLETLLSVIDYYSSIGAAGIEVFFDGAAPFAAGALPQGVRLTECTEAFWHAETGEGTPAGLNLRQRMAYTIAHRRCTADWLLIVDTDELLFSERSLGDVLADIRPAVESARFPTAEAAFGPGDDVDLPFGATHFRTVMPEEKFARVGPDIYGPTAQLMRGGVVGHPEGKHVLRRGAKNVSINLHWSNRRGKSRKISRWIGVATEDRAGPAFLGHYDARSFEHWREKWRRRLATSAGVKAKRGRAIARFNAQIDADRDQAMEVFRRFYCLDERQVEMLRSEGALLRREGTRLVPA